MKHTWMVGGTGQYPVCGAVTAGRGAPATEYRKGELCPACCAWWARKSAMITEKIRRQRGT